MECARHTLFALTLGSKTLKLSVAPLPLQFVGNRPGAQVRLGQAREALASACAGQPFSSSAAEPDLGEFSLSSGLPFECFSLDACS